MTQVILQRLQHDQRGVRPDQAKLLRQALHGLAVAAAVDGQLLQARLRPQTGQQFTVLLFCVAGSASHSPSPTRTRIGTPSAASCACSHSQPSASLRRSITTSCTPRPASTCTSSGDASNACAAASTSLPSATKRPPCASLQPRSRTASVRAPARDRKQALIRRHRRQLFRPIGQQAIADQQVFLHARLRPPLCQRAGTVRAHGLQGCAQFTPVAGADAKRRTGSARSRSTVKATVPSRSAAK